MLARVGMKRDRNVFEIILEPFSLSSAWLLSLSEFNASVASRELGLGLVSKLVRVFIKVCVTPNMLLGK